MNVPVYIFITKHFHKFVVLYRPCRAYPLHRIVPFPLIMSTKPVLLLAQSKILSTKYSFKVVDHILLIVPRHSQREGKPPVCNPFKAVSFSPLLCFLCQVVIVILGHTPHKGTHYFRFVR